MSFELLSEPIRRYIRDKRWEQLRPIQNAAISRILSTEDHYILASRTASGKTEAAFLPILSKVDFRAPGVQVLYISPLIALINDQFLRVEELCKYLDIPVTKWHGEASKSLKERIVKQPEGVVLITPESLEAMFVNKPHHIRHLFTNLRFVVIDEIHAFIGTDRGIQLKSILSRLQAVNSRPFTVVGLSATIGDYEEAKRFTGNETGTKVLLDRTAKEMEVVFRYFKSEGEELPLELLKDLYLETKDNKVLIFPNSRGRAEEVAVKLAKIAQRVKGHPYYFSHHSSVHREVREYVEHFAKNNKRQNFCISCTSTLELGIDIGSVDEVVQIDATHSIASLVQRVGRSGRREGEKSYLFLYATNGWSLLQSLACWLLFQEGYIEPPLVARRPYDILLHQALSIVKGCSGIKVAQLKEELKSNFAFREISQNDIETIIHHLINKDLLEQLRDEVIIGLEGEKIVNSQDFYSVFKTEQNFKVINAGNTIGEIPFSPQIREGENILLAARIWKIRYVDMEAGKIEVIKAADGKKPTFFGGGGVVHERIREKMLELLYVKDSYVFMDEAGSQQLKEMRQDFSIFPVVNVLDQRPLWVGENCVQLYTFTGTRVNRSLEFLFKINEIKCFLDDSRSMIELEASKEAVLRKWEILKKPLADIDWHLEKLLQDSPALLDFSKWGLHLPLEFQIALLKEKYFDFDKTSQWLDKVKLVVNTEFE